MTESRVGCESVGVRVERFALSQIHTTVNTCSYVVLFVLALVKRCRCVCRAFNANVLAYGKTLVY